MSQKNVFTVDNAPMNIYHLHCDVSGPSPSSDMKLKKEHKKYVLLFCFVSFFLKKNFFTYYLKVLLRTPGIVRLSHLHPQLY